MLKFSTQLMEAKVSVSKIYYCYPLTMHRPLPYVFDQCQRHFGSFRFSGNNHRQLRRDSGRHHLRMGLPIPGSTIGHHNRVPLCSMLHSFGPSSLCLCFVLIYHSGSFRMDLGHCRQAPSSFKASVQSWQSGVTDSSAQSECKISGVFLSLPLG
jgi:hypothetical protein